MKIFLNTDVILDYLTGREPFLEEIKVIIDKGIKGEVKLFTSSLIITNVHFFIEKTESSKKALVKTAKLVSFIKILNVGGKEILDALQSKFKVFEDGIQNASARNAKMDLIITSNIKDFKLSKLPILTPKEFLAKSGN